MRLPTASLFVCLAAALPVAAQSQADRLALRPAQRLLKNSIVITGGVMTPLSHPSLKDFWGPGPSVALTLYANVNRFVSFGAGAEGALFSFKESEFSGRYPGVASHPLKTANLHLFVAWKYTGHLGPVFSPTFSATLGGSKITKAVYEERIAGVRTTYYALPGRMRLTLGFSPGMEFAFNRAIAVVSEGRLLYLYKDPEAALLAGARGGLRWNF